MEYYGTGVDLDNDYGRNPELLDLMIDFDLYKNITRPGKQSFTKT